ELNDIKQSRAWTLFTWLRRLRRWLRPIARKSRDLAKSGALAAPFETGPGTGSEFSLPPSARISILIPFKDQLGLLRNCLHSLRRSTYRRLEILLLDNGSTTPSMRRYLEHMHGRRGFRVI